MTILEFCTTAEPDTKIGIYMESKENGSYIAMSAKELPQSMNEAMKNCEVGSFTLETKEEIKGRAHTMIMVELKLDKNKE